MDHKTEQSSSKKSTVSAIVNRKAILKLKNINKSIYGMKYGSLVAKYIAEFIGSFLLVSFFLSLTISGNPIMVSFALVGIVMAVGGISGAHLNPAITFGAWATRKIDSITAVSYIIAQSIGAVAAWSLLSAYLSGTQADASALMGQTGPSLLNAATIAEGKEWYVFGAELIGTAILAFGIATALRARQNKVSAALTQGFSILVALTVAGSLTVLMIEQGSSLTFLNPAIAAAAGGLSTIMTSEWSSWQLAIYVLAPIMGGIIGFGLQDFMQYQVKDETDCNCDCIK